MTISSTTSVELSIDTLVRRAYQLAGLMDAVQGPSSPNWSARAAMARDFMEMDLAALQAEGIMVREVDRYALTITGVDGANPYSLPANTLDVIGDAMFTKSGETVETPVMMRSREEYHALSNKTAAGRPTLYYPERGATVRIYLWPVPSADNAGTLTVQRRKLIATSTDGSATLDLERLWTSYVVWSLAHKLANAAGLPPADRGYLRSQAERELAKAKLYSRQRAPNQMYLDHRTGWR